MIINTDAASKSLKIVPRAFVGAEQAINHGLLDGHWRYFVAIEEDMSAYIK